MARLTLIVEIETDKDYDEAALKNAKQRRANDNNTPTMADHFGKRVSRSLGALKHVKLVKEVLVKVVAEENDVTRPHGQAVG